MTRGPRRPACDCRYRTNAALGPRRISARKAALPRCSAPDHVRIGASALRNSARAFPGVPCLHDYVPQIDISGRVVGASVRLFHSRRRLLEAPLIPAGVAEVEMRLRIRVSSAERALAAGDRSSSRPPREAHSRRLTSASAKSGLAASALAVSTRWPRLACPDRQRVPQLIERQRGARRNRKRSLTGDDGLVEFADGSEAPRNSIRASASDPAPLLPDPGKPSELGRILV